MTVAAIEVPSAGQDGVPEAGQLVQVRGQQWVVSAVSRSHQPVDELAASRLPGQTLVRLASVSDDDLGEELTVVWEVEPGREIVPATKLPEVTEHNWDDPQRLGAFLDAVRWGTVTSADTRTLQAPFRSGISIEEYQLEPVARALAMPRVNLLIADDVGLGKTIEAGLVIQEMLLRHRARRVLVVCPASLTLKWREEMAAKFGLDFRILDTAALRELRRTHGLEANPFAVYPRIIISLQWLRTPRVQRLLDEVLTPQTRYPGYFDLLIVDEAHHCAPPEPPRERGYPVDSKQTQAVRRLGAHTQHRLFLSATPHNGYPGSWQALLEMLDPQRFARGVEPDQATLDQVMVRRMKAEIKNPDGPDRFPGRHIHAIDIRYTDAEREGYELLQQYTAARRAAPTTAGARAGDLVTLILKKRLFSSPAAFALTLESHVSSEEAERGQGRRSQDGVLPDWLAETLEWDAEPSDDEPGSDDEHTTFDLAAPLGPQHSPVEEAYRRRLAVWAEQHAERADSKAQALIEELNRICRQGGDRDSGDRVIVFTEYRATQTWLAGLLTARGFGGGRLGLLYGGMEEHRREHLKAAFQASPDRDPVRILLATDAASEGIDLQRHCHRVIHYDIPFNPNRLEQRIGRVDRHGQTHEVEVAHFAGAGWHHAEPGSYAGDLEYLSRIAEKVATERRDLGSVNPVLAHAVEARMLGRPVLEDPLQVAPKPSTSLLRAERDLREQVRRLRAQLDESVRQLHVAPANVRRVVDIALAMADQPPLAVLPGPELGLIAPPALKAGWERTMAGLADPLSGEPRPLTFDQDIADDRDDVVLAHLEHPLVAQATRLLRSAIWGGRAALHRVAALRFTPPAEAEIDGPLIAVFARLVVVGADGGRLHEEVMLAARVVPEAGRSRRIELEQPRYQALRAAVEDALEPAACRLAPQSARDSLAQRWPELEPLLAGDVQQRAGERLASLQRTLARRRDDETRRIEAVFTQLGLTLRSALEGPGAVQLTFDDLDEPERHQLERDRQAWQSRLDGLEEEKTRELAAVAQRYAAVRELVFPFAVALCVPDPDGSPR
ncbi:MAG: DISARM system SNF2-like helicase DrmD [Streptosporangiaceae bacterium]